MVGQSDRRLSRRAYLAVTSLVGIGGLAGCSGTDDSPDTPTSEESPTEQETTQDTEAENVESPSSEQDDETPSNEQDDETESSGEDNESSSSEDDEPEPRLAVQESSIPSTQLEIGTNLTVTAGIENVGDAHGAFDVEIMIVDDRKQVSVELDPGEREDISVSGTPMTVGRGDILLNDERLGTVEVVPVASESDRTVGAHYFSWYGRHPHTWRDGEWSLESPYTPTLGNYDARDPDVIEQHIDWCHYAGVQWLNAVWTGPDTPIDKNLKNHILTHPRANELEWSIFYDTLIINNLSDDDVSSVDLSDDETATRLKDHIAYVADEYFGREYYKTIDDRPVFYTWLGGSYVGDPAAVFTEAFDEAGVDPYFIVGTGRTRFEAIELSEIADAITTYNPYTPRPDIEDVFLDEMESTYRSWYLTADVTGHDIIPTVIPGFNDSEITHVERDNPVLELSTDRYQNACDVGHKYAEGPIFVTAFNEWYESTFIEPSEEFGTSLLEITADSLAVSDWESPIADGSMVTLSFETVVPATEIAPGTDDPRNLTMRVYELSVFTDGEERLTVDVGASEAGIDFVQGYFGTETESNGKTARWFGGQPDSTVFLEGIAEIDRLEMTGWAGTEMDVTVTVDETVLGTTQVTDQFDTYTIG
jgi:hypothetical protein